MPDTESEDVETGVLDDRAGVVVAEAGDVDDRERLAGRRRGLGELPGGSLDGVAGDLATLEGLAERLDLLGLLAVGDDIGPPQLPEKEQADEQAGGDEQLADRAHDDAQCVGHACSDRSPRQPAGVCWCGSASAGGVSSRSAVACCSWREPLYAGASMGPLLDRIAEAGDVDELLIGLHGLVVVEPEMRSCVADGGDDERRRVDPALRLGCCRRSGPRWC